jgi:hypothetical protein
MKGMEEKMLKKKNEFFVIFGMLALCAMLVSACEDEGGGGENNNPPAEPTSKELAEAAIASMSTLEVGTMSLPGGSLSFKLSGGTKGVTVKLSELKVGGTAVGTLTSSDKATDSLLTLSTNTLVLAGAGEFDDDTAVVATLGFSVKAGSETVEGSKSLTLPPASIASVAPAITALRQVKDGLATEGGSASITGETSAGSIGTITVGATYNPAGSISLVYGSGADSVMVTMSGATTAVAITNNPFEGLADKADFVIGPVESILSVTDTEYAGSAGTELASGSVGIFTSDFTATTDLSSSISATFQPILVGSVSASFEGLILDADGLIYNVPNPFEVKVYTSRADAEYEVGIGTLAE